MLLQVWVSLSLSSCLKQFPTRARRETDRRLIPPSSFCGSASDFCGTGCQAGFGGCSDVNRPSCGGGGGSAGKRTIGYYETWANTRTCNAVSPEDLNLNGFTHVDFAFASFDPSTFQITPMDANAASLYSRFTGLKGKNAGLQTWVSVGGWAFTDRECAFLFV